MPDGLRPKAPCRWKPLKSGTGRTAGRAQHVGDEALLSAALRFLSYCDRTQAQVTAYLDRRGASPGRARAVLAQLRAWGYLDDDAFALRWARDRVARRPMGRARLEAELLAKGFNEETTAGTVRTIYCDRTETELAEALLAKSDGRSRRSVAQQAALLRRFGFQDETIESVLGMERL